MTKCDGWKEIGVVGVDSASIAIVDPCYLKAGHPLLDWKEFCELYGRPVVQQLHFPLGHAGLGLVVRVGSDGGYAVEAKFVDGRMTELRIRLGAT